MKIDTTKIEGYDTMSAEEKLAALEGYEYDDKTAEVEKFKKLNEKANSEAAAWKKKHNELLGEDERKKQEENEAIVAMRSELETLKKEKTISEHKAKFLAVGYNEKLALETATAMAEGNLQTVFDNQKMFLEEHDKALKAETMKQTSTPPAGVGSSADFQRQIDEALARGDVATAAALTRRQYENIK